MASAGTGDGYLRITEYEPDRSRFPVRGIDVSHHQGAIDWMAVAAADVAFAYVKVSEGGDHRDREFRRNIGEANRLGLPVGAYHFFTFGRPGIDQAQNFIEAAPADALQLPPVVDLEFTGNSAHRPAPDDLRYEIEAFVDLVESRLCRMLVYYASDDFLEVYGTGLPRRPLWRRSIGREPDNSDWTIWQYHSAGRIAGIDRDVDLDVLSVSLNELLALGDRRGPPAKPG